MRFQKFDICDGVLKRVCPHTGNDRQALCMILCQVEDLYLLFVSQAWGLTCSSERYEKIDPAGHLSVNQCCKRLIIHFAVLERSYQRSSAAFES